ncbi:Glutaryl-CoA dehydrogenase [Trichosporon asahii var. asahii CBS 8904]|uniref:Glutaryl-CoA dehydrogenase n=1 Tax=Trichosporon asahii var. asahii (strain CBS 8904) TaxID=1220162 RepID=K1VGD6_TRIAC|nr:Glutaryl-CoA dehydrogenase [Trichosporon asahii var. asahii CBS 8904]
MLRTIRPQAALRAATPQARSMAKFAPYNWEDPLNMSSLLTEEQQAIHETARTYAQEKLVPRIKEGWRTEKLDLNILKEMGELGLLGPTIQGYGCAGTDYISYGLIMREVERADSGFRSAMSVQSSLVMTAINQFGSEAQKEQYLPGLAKADILGCFGLTEPNHGSDPSSMETTATKKDGGWVINGQKTWITNAPYGDFFIIWATTVENGVRGKIRGFIVPRDAGDIQTPQITNKLALRGSVTGSVFIDNVHIPAENVLEKSNGLGAPFSCLNHARYGISWGVMGALEDCIDKARTYALERHQFNRPLASFQLVQKKLVDASSAATLGLLGSLHLGHQIDKGVYNPEMISILKRNNCGNALQHSRILLDILGGNACSDEYGIGRHEANLQVCNTYEGTYDVHTLILGKAMTGISAFAN